MSKSIKLLENIAEKVIAELKTVGVDAYIWHRATTGSVYIRFEDSRVGSIRIGNHEGRKHLKYRYNLRNDLKLKEGKWIKDGDKWRFFAPFERWRELIPLVASQYKKVKSWGENPYSYTVPKHKE